MLLALYDFPAEHWIHLRTTNPIESTFATVRLRTDKTRGCVSQDSILSLVFKLVQSAQKRWLRIRGFKRLGEVIEGVQFKGNVNLTVSFVFKEFLRHNRKNDLQNLKSFLRFTPLYGLMLSLYRRGAGAGSMLDQSD